MNEHHVGLVVEGNKVVKVVGTDTPAVERALHDLRVEIEKLQAEVDLWKDRCMAAEQAHDATVERYEQLTNREW